MVRDYDLEIATADKDFSRRYPEQAKGVRDNLDVMAGIMRKYHAEVNSAKGSGDYTQSGLHTLKVKAATKAKAELDALRNRLSVVQTQIDAELKAMKPKPKSTESELVRYLREREIRDTLRGMDSLEVKAMCLDALNRPGFDEVLDAIESAPSMPGKPLLDRKSLEEIRQLRLQRDNPDKHGMIIMLNHTMSVLDGFLKPSYRELEEVLGSETAIRDVATGKAIHADDNAEPREPRWV